MAVTRRQFMKVSAAGLAASSVGALGFIDAGDALAADVRTFKLACDGDPEHLPLLLRRPAASSLPSATKRRTRRPSVVHVEGDPDHPVNRGTLCPKGAALLDFMHSPNRLSTRCSASPARTNANASPGTTRRPDRPAHEGRPRQELRRRRTPRACRSTAGSPPACSAARIDTNETSYLTGRSCASLGMLVFDNQARV